MIFFILILTLVSCNHLSDPFRQLAGFSAEQFDRYVQGRLIESEAARLKEECQTAPQKSIFCASINRSDVLERRIRARSRPPEKVTPRSLQPIWIEFRDGKIQNWRHVRGANVRSLVKGLGGISFDVLNLLAQEALKYPYCPNNVGSAVAASLEDYLPENISYAQVAALYEKSARCLGANEDREHFLTRAGLFYFKIGNDKKARSLFEKALLIKGVFAARLLYWVYQIEKRSQRDQEALEVLNKLSKEYPFAFHTVVALTSENRDPMRGWIYTPEPLPARSQKKSPWNAFPEQAEELFRNGFEETANLIADWGMDESNGVETGPKLYLLKFSSPTIQVRKVGEILAPDSQANRGWLELYFPKAYISRMEKHSRLLNPLLLLSVARQESTFNPNAISPQNAQGLLQIHPSTAAKLGSSSNLFDLDTNITLGARYLSDLLKRWDGNTHLALAAYNAGEEKLFLWRKRYPTSNPILFIDLLSYRETRNYVGAVLRNYYWYRRIYGPEKNKVNVLDMD